MPVVVVNVIEGSSLDQKRELAKAITQALVDIIHVVPEHVFVQINEDTRENVANAGVLLCDR